MPTSFIKMHGLGNDFAVIDVTTGGAVTPDQARTIADRRRGVGCDQVLVMEKPKNPKANVFMRIYNPDGSEAQACGNGTRCVASLYMAQNNVKECVIETVAGLLPSRIVDDGLIQVDMGVPRTKWNEIPLSQECDTLNLGIMHGRQTMNDPVAVNVGNPHTIFFVDDVAKIELEKLGPEVENHVLFPERTNVEFAQVLSPEKIRVRVWERGTGVTQACGSGACATIVAAARRGLTGRKAEIILDGGSLYMEWRQDDNHILMTGAATRVYEGVFKVA
jgi:diaminopimelate epimerase